MAPRRHHLTRTAVAAVTAAGSVLTFAGVAAGTGPTVVHRPGPTTAAVGAAGVRAAAAAPAEVHAPVPQLHWRSCPGDPTLRCTRARVPLDYDQPRGATISLRLVKRPADQPARRIGTLFVNPGGPGGSAADFVGYAAQHLGAPVRARFDVIGIDPRGVAGSTPVMCVAKPGDPPLPPAPNVAFPRGHQQIEGWFAYDEGVRRLCAARGNAILDHMSTADTARDMDLIRQAVGDSKLTYYGISYGTMLGSTYAAMFPGRVRAIVLDGVLDPVQWTTGRFGRGTRYLVSARLRSGYGAWEALTSAFAECDRVGKPLCPQAGHIGTEWNRLTAKLRQGPVHAGRQRITYADVIGNILGGLYDARYYPDILRFIHQVYRQVFTSQPNAAQAAGEAWADLQRDAAASGGSPPRYGSVIGRAPAVQPARDRLSPQFQGVLCSDSVNPRHESAAVPSAHFASHQGPGFGALWSWLSSVCVDWPGSSADAFRGPWRTVTSNPLLITGNVHDPATPISGARAANKLFEGSRLITVNTWGHGALGHSRCATAKWDRYWVSGRLPASGLVCRPNAHLFHH